MKFQVFLALIMSLIANSIYAKIPDPIVTFGKMKAEKTEIKIEGKRVMTIKMIEIVEREKFNKDGWSPYRGDNVMPDSWNDDYLICQLIPGPGWKYEATLPYILRARYELRPFARLVKNDDVILLAYGRPSNDFFYRIDNEKNNSIFIAMQINSGFEVVYGRSKDSVLSYIEDGVIKPGCEYRWGERVINDYGTRSFAVLIQISEELNPYFSIFPQDIRLPKEIRENAYPDNPEVDESGDNEESAVIGGGVGGEVKKP